MVVVVFMVVVVVVVVVVGGCGCGCCSLQKLRLDWKLDKRLDANVGLNRMLKNDLLQIERSRTVPVARQASRLSARAVSDFQGLSGPDRPG